MKSVKLILLIATMFSFIFSEAQSKRQTYLKNNDSLFYWNAGWKRIPTVNQKSATLDFPSTSTLTSADLTVTVNGAAVGDIVGVGTPAAPDANTCYTAFVSAANTVTVRFNNYSAGTVNPASGIFNVVVTRK